MSDGGPRDIIFSKQTFIPFYYFYHIQFNFLFSFFVADKKLIANNRISEAFLKEEIGWV